MHSGGRVDGGDYVEMEERSSANFTKSDLDRVLYNDLVQIVPLVQSLIDRNSNTSFTRRGSMVYTKTPSRDSRKNNKNGVNSKHGVKEEGKHSKNDTDRTPDDQSVENMAAKREELNSLRAQLEDLRRKLLEKDEHLKEAEMTKNQIISIQSQVNELKQFAAERDSLVKSSQSQLNDAKIKLADKQAAVEKLQWETRTSNQKVESLQEELDSMQSQVSSLMQIFESLSKHDSITSTVDYDITPYYVDHHLPDLDDMTEIKMKNMEEAREAYVAAVGVAKEKQDEESLLAAARARVILQSFVSKTKTNLDF